MPRRPLTLWRAALLAVFALVLSSFTPARAAASAASPSVTSVTPAPFAAHSAFATDGPAVDPDYIYAQLDYLATHFLRREAGFDDNLPPNVNGHDEFAAYWEQELERDLGGYGSTTSHFMFTTTGWQNRPPVVPAFNVEVTVPGAVHPEQVVVVGCHYDGESTSTQSANDDASGCAIALGVAKAIGDYWRANHLYPARTLRFVAYDAEEQGLVGSTNYVNTTVNGDLGNVVAMFNEEQNGIAYPLRYLSAAANPQLPLDILLSPLTANAFYPEAAQLTPAQRDHIAHFHDLMAQAVPAVFAQFRALGYTALTYRDNARRPVTQPVFTQDQTSQLLIADDYGAGSDQIPFTRAGVACATFVGNATYYDSNPPPWSYPYDQPDDTIQLMNTVANGTSQKAEALALALSVPGMLTTWMLHQPDVLGEAPADSLPVATIGDVGPTLAGKPLSLNAAASLDASRAGPLNYAWDFGDGATTSGQSVTHTYTRPDDYTLRLTVTGPTGARQVVKPLTITTAPTVQVPLWPNKLSGAPRANPVVTLPRPDESLNLPPSPTPSAHSSGPPPWLMPLVAALAAIGVAAFLIRRRSRAATPTTPSTKS